MATVHQPAEISAHPERVSPLTEELGILATRLVRTIRRNLDGVAGMRVLSILDVNGPMGVSDLARADGCSQPTMSTAVAALVEAGMVDREPHPTDARGSLIKITASGSAELQDFRATYAAMIHERLVRAGRSEAELAVAVSLLRDILDQ